MKGEPVLARLLVSVKSARESFFEHKQENADYAEARERVHVVAHASSHTVRNKGAV